MVTYRDAILCGVGAGLKPARAAPITMPSRKDHPMPASKSAPKGAAKAGRATPKTPPAKETALPSQQELLSALQQFGHDRFRPAQERIVKDLLSGRDVLAVLPTGAGKSLVFQLAAQFLDGVTLVVSPLIALMKDQVEAINEQGVGASVINSTLGEAAAEEIGRAHV